MAVIMSPQDPTRLPGSRLSSILCPAQEVGWRLVCKAHCKTTGVQGCGLVLQAALELSWSAQGPLPRTTHLRAWHAACDFSLTRCSKKQLPVPFTVEKLSWGCGWDLGGRRGRGQPFPGNGGNLQLPLMAGVHWVPLLNHSLAICLRQWKQITSRCRCYHNRCLLSKLSSPCRTAPLLRAGGPLRPFQCLESTFSRLSS